MQDQWQDARYGRIRNGQMIEKRQSFFHYQRKGILGKLCANNRIISLISHASKVLLHIIAERIRNTLDSELPPEQAGFRRGRGTRN